ncbi:MAG TPA: hypothetical protein VK747_01885 [Blastocatellia bacterium]|nr:hypothetical protein [Blastocatellia bacterium]
MVQSGLHTKALPAGLSFNHRCRLALRDVFPVWLALATATTIPYVVAGLRTPVGHRFSGVLTAYDDTFSYLAWMKQSAGGRWLMCDLYTSEPQACEFFLPLWMVLGKISRITGAPPVWVFHGARLAASLLLLIAARSVACRVMKSRRRLRLTLWMYAMSGGLGWLVFLLNNGRDLLNASVISGSVDLNLPEAIAFRSAFAQVHFTLGAALVAFAINLVFSSLMSGKINRGARAGLLVSLLAVVHPYVIVVVFAVAGVALALWPLLDFREHVMKGAYVNSGFAFGVAAIPGVAYLVYLNRSNEVLREWLRVTDTPSPPPLEYALGFGLLAVLAIVGLRLLWTVRSPAGRLVVIWVIVQAALLYAPVAYQRRFVEGLQLPLCVAASAAVFWLMKRLRLPRRARSLAVFALVASASLTNAGFIVSQLVERGHASGANDPRRYLPSDLAEALNWLSENGEIDAVIFSSYLTGNIAPSMTGLRVYLGHYGQTLRSGEKGGQVTLFYRGELADDATRELFTENRVSYVIYGPFERAMGESPDVPSWLLLAYQSGDVRVFKVAERSSDQSQR